MELGTIPLYIIIIIIKQPHELITAGTYSMYQVTANYCRDLLDVPGNG